MTDLDIPTFSPSFLNGQDILYTQFNEVNFYVEDIDQENLYYIILKKLFGSIKFEKIFPLGGKTNVVEAAKKEIGNKKNIYLVDLDFDGILERIETYENLFYLKRYSIENYLIELNPLLTIVIEEKPKLKMEEVKKFIDLELLLEESLELFKCLIPYFILIQEQKLGIKNTGYEMAYFCDLKQTPPQLVKETLINYHNEIDAEFKFKKEALIFDDELKKYEHLFYDTQTGLINIPGKYMLNFLKYKIEFLFKISKMELESFVYRLAKFCEFASLDFLKDQINLYLA